MNKGKREKSDNSEGRKIKQVYLSEDGSEETTATIAVIEGDSDEGNEKERRNKRVHEHEKEHGAKTSLGQSAGTKAIRITAVAVTMIFSMVLAMAVGVWLALWDSNRTIADLNGIMFGEEVEAATHSTGTTDSKAMENVKPMKSDKTGIKASASSGTAEKSSEKAEDEAADGNELDAESVWDDGEGPVDSKEFDYGSTFDSDNKGSDKVAKAGSDDEIVKDEEDAEDDDADPTADYPLPFTTVDESYFTDALFIGDSRLQGFGFWSGLPATYYCATGFQLYKYDTAKVVQTENGKVPIFEAMPYDAFTKIYIKVGLNELGYGTEENFEKYYAQLIEQLREYEPRAIIYVHALLPVTAEKSASDKAHNNPNITARNESLKKFAESQKAYFLDAGPVLSTDDGSLRPEMTTDGIHLSAQYMKIWRDYLCEHAIVIP